MTADGPGVVVHWSAIASRLEANGGDGVWLAVKADSVKAFAPDLMTAAEAAVHAANRRLETGRPEGPVVGLAPQASLSGPVVDLHHIGSDDEVHEWLSAFAETLVAAGVRGQITAAPDSRLPKAYDDLTARAKLTAFLALTTQDPVPPHGPPMWLVDPGTTKRLSDFVGVWGGEARPDSVYVSQGSFSLQFTEAPSPWRVARVIRGRRAKVQFVVTSPRTVRTFGSASFGECAFSTAGPDNDWRTDLDRVRRPMLGFAGEIRLGVVRRRAAVYASSWLDFDSMQPLPPVKEALWRYNRHLWDRFVIDAHGSQVLTSAHVHRAHDLSGWNVRDLGHDRFLVEAKDLEAWFAADAADDEKVNAYWENGW